MEHWEDKHTLVTEGCHANIIDFVLFVKFINTLDRM